LVYRRREIWLLLILALSLGLGLAIREFRSGFPDLSERLERLDSDEPAPRPVTSNSPSAAFVSQRPPKLSESQVKKDGPLDLNHATVADLQRLPGIGPTLAGQIVRERERRGRFASPEDLLTVPGIGRKKFEGLRDLVTVKGGKPEAGREIKD
jgi:competence ComEA-like helix-hairpin-helix protein